MPLPHSIRLLTAGILALPALLILVVVSPFIAILSIPSLAILVRRKRHFVTSFAWYDDLYPLLGHAVITGGSSGIGLAIALDLARRGCRNITLIARKEGQLLDAKRLVEAASSRCSTTETPAIVRIVSVDVTNFEALDKAISKLIIGNNDTNDDSVANAIGAETSTNVSLRPGPPTLLFHCAGYSLPLAFDDLSPSDFRAQMDVNYLGSVHIVKAILAYMTKGGNIVLTSSMSGQAGTYGYSAYSPTKFALRGFAECLSMELATRRRGLTTMSNYVNVSLAYPPDTKTPGYEIENRSKPEACRLISESGGIWDANVVGKGIVEKALCTNPPFDIYFGIDGWMLSTLSAGMSPVTSDVDVICQVALMGLLRFVSLFYLMDFGRITQNCRETKILCQDTCKQD